MSGFTIIKNEITGEDEAVLDPITVTTEEWDEIEKRIIKLFLKEIYEPLIKELGKPKNTLKNDFPKPFISENPLITAIRSGRIQFYRGTFSGEFSSSVSKELKAFDAKWDRKTRTFKIPLSQLPTDIQTAIQMSEKTFFAKIAGVEQKLRELNPESIAQKLQVAKFFDSSLFKFDKKYQKTLAKITVAPKLTAKQRDIIATDYETNIQRYIKDFTVEQIVDLREKIQKSVLKGKRYDSMINIIQKSYGVSQNKAKFLARQETRLMMSSFEKARYMEAGSDKYIWQNVVGSPAHPVRPMHKKLDGTKQKWNNPPITNEKGDQNNPGEDYNCRCKARPVIKFKR